MASLFKAGAGWMLQWADADAPSGRRSVRLPKMPRKNADSTLAHVEAILEAKAGGYSIPLETVKWSASLPDAIHAKLSGAAGLLQPRNRAKLGPFLTEYAASRIDLKEPTRIVRGQVERNLREHFGEQRDLHSINAGDAEGFRLYLVGQQLAPTTIHKRLQVAREVFKAAVRHKLIDANPFAEIRHKAVIDPSRFHFVSTADATKLLDAAPNADWRCIIALSRFGGMRCPSEVLSLTWQDINWAEDRFVVTSPKGEKDGKGTRVVPLFPELKTVLAEALELAPKGAVYVVDPKYRLGSLKPSGWMNCNLRTTFEKIVRRAGLASWPRLFHAMRASRETELTERFPIHVVTAWLGNTPKVALKHYLMTTEADFAKAVEPAPEAPQQVLQKCMQQPAVSPAIPARGSNSAKRNPGFAGVCDGVPLFATPSVAGTGFEPVTSRL